MPNLVGTGLNQVPINGMLGGLAYQDPEHASIKNLDLKNLSQINSEIADTAVDVFVYDTRKDSDGGAWRKRTQNTSWYNETLNTSTRGSRKEFPAVAVIVCGTDGSNGLVHIYDGDDPDLPMWMTFNANAAALYTTPNAVVAMNGMIFVGTPTYGLPRYDFIGDTIGRYRAGAYQGYKSPDRTIKGRSVAHTSSISAPPFDTAALVNDNINDIAITVLPNAPIDDTTGLPIPTIAVATDGGLSIINDDGTVSSPLSGNHVGSTIDISDDFVLYYGNESQGGYYPYDVKTATYIDNARFFGTAIDGPVTLLENISTSTNENVLFTGDDGQSLAIGMDNGLNLINGDPRNGISDNGMIAYIASDYNTG